MAAVWDLLPSLDAGRPVLSTVRILDFRNPRECPGCDLLEYHDGSGRTHQAAHPLYVPLREWEQLLEAERCDVLLDEVTGVASSRESHSMPAPVANKLVQLRRADVTVRWTAPSWARADKIIRECSQAVTYCRGYMSKEMSDEGGDRLWRNRRLFRWVTYDADAFEDFTAGKREQLPPMGRDWHWAPGSPVLDAYDTFDAVSTVGTVTDSGRCYRCGGRRPVPSCKCPAHDAPRTSQDVDAASPEGEDVGGLVVPGKRRRLALAD